MLWFQRFLLSSPLFLGPLAPGAHVRALTPSVVVYFGLWRVIMRHRFLTPRPASDVAAAVLDIGNVQFVVGFVDINV